MDMTRRERDIKEHPELAPLIAEVERRAGKIKEIHDKRERDEDYELEEDTSNMFDFVTVRGIFTIIFDDGFTRIDEFHTRD
jgi:hypothetical protein